MRGALWVHSPKTCAIALADVCECTSACAPSACAQKHRHLLPRPRVLDDGVFVHVRLQRLEPRLVFLFPSRFQLYKHADLIDNGRLAKPRQPLYGCPHR
jgi:hypothetical protein